VIGDDQVIRPGEMRPGLDTSSFKNAYLATARQCKADRRRLDIVCADESAADGVAGHFAGASDLQVCALSGAPTEPASWRGTYSSDVLVASIHGFAVDYLYETLHAEEQEVGAVPRQLLLLDAADLVLGQRGHWRAEVRVDDDTVLDRLLYVDFASIYDELCGTYHGTPDDVFVARCRRLGVGGDFPSSGSHVPSERQRLNAWGESVRDEAASVEFKQRTALAEDRAMFVDLSGSLPGIERLILRALDACADVRHGLPERDSFLRSLGVSFSLAQGSSDAGLRAIVTDRLSPRRFKNRADRLIAAARTSALRVHAPLWKAHLVTMDGLGRQYSQLSSGADFEHYVEEAYKAFNQVRADALVTWAAWVTRQS